MFKFDKFLKTINFIGKSENLIEKEMFSLLDSNNPENWMAFRKYKNEESNTPVPQSFMDHTDPDNSKNKINFKDKI